MWNGKNKAFTLSYDDGVEQDRRLLEIINSYGLKCTFNLNSGIMTPKSSWLDGMQTIKRMPPEGMHELYKGHEIAVHGLTHADLSKLSDEEIRREIGEDKANLEKLFGCEIKGKAYPYGAYSDKIISIASEAGIRFARTCEDTYVFGIPKDLMKLGATCHHSCGHLDKLIDDFLVYDGEEPALFMIWGHSYEFDVYNNWQRFEEICRKISGRDDVYYCTNSQALLDE